MLSRNCFINLYPNILLKNHTKFLWRWEPDRKFNFFFSPRTHLCAVTYITEISLHVTLSNQSHSHLLPLSCKTILSWSSGLKRGLPGVGSNPTWNIYFHFKFFAPSPFRTAQRSLCKWNQAWPFACSHSCLIDTINHTTPCILIAAI